MRRGTSLLTVAVLLAAGAAGCGIPGSTNVQVDGPGPAVEAGSVNGQGREAPKRLSAGTDHVEFMKNFLAVAAGEPNQAYARVKDYLAADIRGQLPEKQGIEVVINVVRLKEELNPTPGDDGTTTFDIDVQQVGVLRADGTLGPPVANESTYRFEVGPVPLAGSDKSEGLFVRNPPKALLLSVDALRDYYEPHTIYFWNTKQNALVPDQRYLPVAVPPGRRATEVVSWLIDGPAQWLEPTVTRLPDRTELIGTVPKTDGRLEINLGGPVEDAAQLERLATQLAWSLPDVNGQLELKIRNQTRKLIDDTDAYLRDHPLYQLTAKPQRYCVYNGSVHALTPVVPGEANAPVPIAPDNNRNIVSAAFSGTGANALVALVTVDAKKQRLRTIVGQPSIGKANDSLQAFESIRRPVWLRSADARRPVGLVVADGELYRFGADARLVKVEANAKGPVTAVAAALDGHRIAFVAAGKLYVAALTVEEETVTVGPPRQLPTSLTELSAVDWSRENGLVVAGSTGRPAIYEISIDGTREILRKTDVGEAEVSDLAAYPDNRVVSAGYGLVMYETNGVAFPDLSSSVGIRPEQVVGASVARDGVNPTAPFFRY